MSLVSIVDEDLERGVARVVRLVDMERRNAISFEMLDELEAVIDAAERGDDDVVVLVLAHEGKAFCAGTDLVTLASVADDETASRELLGRIVTLFDRVERLPLPTIAAIDGVAVGGGFELALACDFRIMQPDSWVSLPEVTLGAVPGGGGAHRLHRFIGRSRTLDLVLTGRRLDAASCESLGLCRIDVGGDSTAAALALAGELSANSSRAMAETKRLLINSETITPEEARRAAVDAMIAALGSDDGRIGLDAVRRQARPRFSDAPVPGREAE
jgi:enoyl-CoA hydratase/carnithine racemase